MDPNPQKLREARRHLDEAIKEVESTSATWAESVTTLHMAEINLRSAQRRMRKCYDVLAEVLNGDA